MYTIIFPIKNELACYFRSSNVSSLLPLSFVHKNTKPPIFFKIAYLVCDVNILSTFSICPIKTPCFYAESGIEDFSQHSAVFDIHGEICYNKNTKRGTADRWSVQRLITQNKSNRFLGRGGYFFVWFMYTIKIDTMIPRIIRTTVSSS